MDERETSAPSSQEVWGGAEPVPSPSCRQGAKCQVGGRKPLLKSRQGAIGGKGLSLDRIGEAAAKELLTASPKGGRHFPLRLVMWLILVVGAFAGIEQFLRSTWFPRSSEAETVSYWKTAVEALGPAATLPPGLHEVQPSYLPDLEVFPSGVVDCVQRQLDTSTKRGLPIEVENSIGMRFRLVPAGECMIGSPVAEAGHSVVENRHVQYILEPYYMGQTEVTQGQWESVMGPGSNPSHFRGGALPVEEVSWVQCQEFVRRLNEREGLPRHTYRLPSEAEWEYACRGGSESAYCFGDEVERLGDWADYADNNYKGTSKVGQKRPNALGLYDMHGNVWEWCRDYYRNYVGDETPWSSAHTYRCLRGGNWYVSAIECRSANRSRLPDRSAGNMLGFRVMRVCPEEP